MSFRWNFSSNCMQNTTDKSFIFQTPMPAPYAMYNECSELGKNLYTLNIYLDGISFLEKARQNAKSVLD